MGLLDDAIGAVKGAISEGAQGGAHDILNNVLQGSSLGGVSGILEQLHSGGLGDLVSSWAGGQGQAISADQLKAALTPEHIQEIAGRLGMDPNSALMHLAEYLPALAGKQA